MNETKFVTYVNTDQLKEVVDRIEQMQKEINKINIKIGYINEFLYKYCNPNYDGE